MHFIRSTAPNALLMVKIAFIAVPAEHETTNNTNTTAKNHLPQCVDG